MSHAIVRTSSKGPGEKFIGACTKCGAGGLKLSDALRDCPADSIVSDHAALLQILETPKETTP